MVTRRQWVLAIAQFSLFIVDMLGYGPSRLLVNLFFFGGPMLSVAILMVIEARRNLPPNRR